METMLASHMTTRDLFEMSHIQLFTLIFDVLPVKI